jgi:hypothetical protein
MLSERLKARFAELVRPVYAVRNESYHSLANDIFGLRSEVQDATLSAYEPTSFDTFGRTDRSQLTELHDPFRTDFDWNEGPLDFSDQAVRAGRNIARWLYEMVVEPRFTRLNDAYLANDQDDVRAATTYIDLAGLPSSLLQKFKKDSTAEAHASIEAYTRALEEAVVSTLLELPEAQRKRSHASAKLMRATVNNRLAEICSEREEALFFRPASAQTIKRTMTKLFKDRRFPGA